MQNQEIINKLDKKYELGFSEEIQADLIPKGLSEEIVRFISEKKNEPEWLLEFRLKAFEEWKKMKPPQWAGFPEINNIDYQDIHYYSAPKKIDPNKEIDENLMNYFEKLGVPINERDILSGKVAVDAVLDSVSVGTTFKEKLKEVGVIFCSFSEAVQEHPELVREYMGSVVSYKDNYFACLNSAVFTDGSFCYIPKGVHCPMELSTYFRINQANTGQFERTLIVAEDDSYVSYLEGCFLPGTLVLVDKGFVPIQFVGPDTKNKFTFDHLGQRQKILNRQEKFVQNKVIFNFKFKFSKLNFTCTHEHPIYVLRDGEKIFVEANEIRKTDKLSIHKNQYNAVFKYLLLNEGTFASVSPKEEEDYFHFDILDIERKEYTGMVYNLEIENTHTYNVNGFAVHNCSAPQRDENQLHAAVVEIVAKDRAKVKYSTVQNWYPGDENGRGGVYNFVTKRALAKGYKSHVSWNQVETGSAITWKYPSVVLKGDESSAEFYSVALTNHMQKADTGTKMIHMGKNTSSIIVSKSISAGNSEGTYRGLVRISPNADNAKNKTECDSLIFGNAQVFTHPYVETYNYTANLEHEASTSKISEEQIFYLEQRGIKEEDAKNLIVNGFCKSVFQKLPAEFAVEAQKLIEINLEGSLG